MESPTLVLPNGSAQDASALLKYDQSGSANGAITYNVHMADLKGEEVELVKTSTLCFPYPEGLDQNSARKYRIIIHHKISDEKTEVFKSEDGDIDFTPQGLCIRVSSFSPFEITWEESVMPDGAALPETGDGSLPLVFPLLAAAASCFGLCLIGKRRLG